MAAATGIVTPEAVRLDFDDAGIGSRGIALLLDALIVITTLVTVSIGTGALLEGAPLPDWVPVSTLLVLNLVLLFGYPIVSEVAFGGRTLGKAALGLRVVTREGAPVGFRHAAIRSAFMLVDFIATAGAGAVLSAALTRRSQRLGDLVAGTVVLRQRQAAGTVQAVQFEVPRGAERYAAAISPNAIDAPTYERIRSFLLRAPELDDAARHRVAVSLAEPLLGSTPSPPAGMPPALYLQVLAAVYQRGHRDDDVGRTPAGTGRVVAGSTSPTRVPGAGQGSETPDGARPSETPRRPAPPSAPSSPAGTEAEHEPGFAAPD